MKNIRQLVAKNAFANLIRGGATAVVAIALPHFLTRSLSPEQFAGWSLILQIAAYASFLDFGLQTAVARFMAQAIELKQEERQQQLMSTTLILLSIAALIAFTVISIVIGEIPHLFHGVSRSLLPELRLATFVLTVSTCLQLPLSAFTGVLIGMHRNEIPAMAIGISRVAGAVAAIIAARYTQSLTVLTLCVGVPNVLGGLVQMVAVRRLIRTGRRHVQRICRTIGKELLHYCTGLMIWSFATLLVTGLDVTIVGYFRFSAVGYYSVAAMLITFVAGSSGSMLNALMTPVAALHALRETDRIRKIVFSATRLTMLLNALLTMTVFLWGAPLLRLWVGPVYASDALPILKILVVAQTIRLTVSPYAVMLLSVGEQGKGAGAAICEALLNLFASIGGAILLGPIGVAWGTLIGAIGGLLWTLIRVMPSVRDIQIGQAPFIKNAVLPGLIPCIPFVIFWLALGHLSPMAYGTLLVICIGAALLLGIRYATFYAREHTI